MKNIIVTILVSFLVLNISAQNKIAPDFTVTDYKGNSFNLYNDILAQDKALLIKFFFVDCPPCNNIAPSVQQLYTQEWNSGNDRVEFIELSVKSWDNDNKVRGYAQKHGITFPSAGADGGSVAASNPYTSGQFGLFFGTPTFVVIAPDSTVHFGLRLDQVSDTLTEVLKKDDGGGGCSTAFSIDIDYYNNPIMDSSNIIVQMESDIQGSKVYDLFERNGKYEYECEFELPVNNQAYYIKPKYNGDAWTDVSTRDLVVILKHLLGKKLIEHTATKIAADVNDTKTISVTDISTLRKVILGSWDEFRMVKSHRFWDADEKFEGDTFPNEVPYFREEIPLMELAMQEASGNFGCVKMGDLTTIEEGLSGIKSRSAQTLYLDVEDQLLRKDGVYEIPVAINHPDEILAFQAAFKSNNSLIEIKDIKFMGSSNHHFDQHFDLQNKSYNVLWYDVNELKYNESILLVTLKAKKEHRLHESLYINALGMSSLYTNIHDQEGKVELRFKNIKSNNGSITIMPNPVYEEKFILNNSSPKQISGVSILDYNGQIIRSEDILISPYSHAELHMNNIKLHGFYLLKTTFSDGSEEVHKLLFH